MEKNRDIVFGAMRACDDVPYVPLFQSHPEEYSNGASARFDGLPDGSCPYAQGVRREAWMAGWWDEDAIQDDIVNP